MNEQSAVPRRGEEVVLSFGDSLLRQSDVELLRCCGWLNDRLIGFYFEYLERIGFKDYAAKVCFVTPDVTQFVKLHEGDDAELRIFLEPLALHTKDLVLLAVNDNQSNTHAGGAHWTLLTYWRPGNLFECYDSAGSVVPAPARLCSVKLTRFLGAATSPTFEVVDCPKQENSYDCGVYVLMFAERVCGVKLQGKTASLLSSITADCVTRLRIDTLALIQSLCVT
ncbi:Sentrin-specific protease 8 [Geodia barretti]|uniref:Sentrin-specific protease 8 n=1 Tax=Geodia barretti TaxID=519541 RepID=A0AA35R083_GEOBA|nr:Sentrin-specific protease 8 [Geodia barretti]